MVRALLLACLRQSTTTTTTIATFQRPIVSKLPAIRHVATWRVLIRPHYYNQPSKSSLSKALQQQRNPIRQFQRRLDNANPNTVLYALLGVNGAVFLAWQYAINSYKTFGDGRWLNFMAANFMNSTEAFKHGRFHTLLTSAISHRDLGHLGLNMLVLYSMGQAAIEALGASRFLLLYSGAGIAASLATLAYRQYLRPMLERKRLVRGNAPFGSLGASGSVMGITTFYACAFPRTTFLLFFVIPMPAIAVVLGVAGYDFYQAFTLKNEIVDSAAHLGGTAYGAAYWFLRVKPLLRAGRWRV
ncbi:rhomboid-domain-containing protein [Lichtheimia hyalospora FSU 10163]|nr:rhomboid-domain-containing protein [Lichtheimia hyalospora FSU 10163]